MPSRKADLIEEARQKGLDVDESWSMRAIKSALEKQELGDPFAPEEDAPVVEMTVDTEDKVESPVVEMTTAVEPEELKDKVVAAVKPKPGSFKVIYGGFHPVTKKPFDIGDTLTLTEQQAERLLNVGAIERI